jgi:hypothetical protein
MTTCVDTLGPPESGQEPNVLCPQNHCEGFQYTSAFHRVCNCVDWQGNPIQNCLPKDNLYPVQTGDCYNPQTETWELVNSKKCTEMGPPWYFRTCYCCCSCLAAETPVADPGGFKALEDYAIGDEVLAAARSGDSWSWESKTVAFSSGSPATTSTGPRDGNITVCVEYGDGKWLIATPNQLFALPDGNLKRADQLAPSHDQLAGADGGAVPITRVSTGYYKGGIHHISTSMVPYDEFDGSIDGHLINANGIVCGDYLLQMFQDTKKMKPHIESSAPSIGTYAYSQAYPDLFVKPYVVGESDEVVGNEASIPDFVFHGEPATDVPEGAASLFSRRQAAILLDPNIPKRGFSDKTNVQQFEWFAAVYQAFSPDVKITLDWENTSPNVYAWENEGGKNVLVGGELLRMGPLYGQAIAMALGFGVAAATGEAESVGQTLYEGIGAVMHETLGTYWMKTALAGQKQFDRLLAALAKEEGTSDIEGGLGATCLSEVVDAAVSGFDLPQCAGGGVEPEPETS